MNTIQVSNFVEQQLPEFIREEYPVFVKFIEKYYEWLEQEDNVLNVQGNLEAAKDVDIASDYFVNRIRENFLPYFPQTSSLDKRKFIKLANQFYTSKGTPSSIEFLFRALYNDDVSLYFPKEDILKVSDGKWILPLALRIDTDDNNIFNIERCKITGQLSKSTALVEKVIESVDRQLGIKYIELYISNVEKLFQTGEVVTASYYDSDLEQTITASGIIIGSLSEIKIDPKNRGLFYNGRNFETGYPGDPVTIVGGLNPVSNTPIGAIAYVDETTTGSITDLRVVNGGFGFRRETEYPGCSLVDFLGGFGTGGNIGSEARATISIVDESIFRVINVCNTTIESYASSLIEDVSVGIVGAAEDITIDTISVICDFESINVHPISFVSLDDSGGGYKSKPDIDVHSFYREETAPDISVATCSIGLNTNILEITPLSGPHGIEPGDKIRLWKKNTFEQVIDVLGVSGNRLTVNYTFTNIITGVTVYKILKSELRDLGSLGLIYITSGGEDYQVGDSIVFSGGRGYGANAVVSKVNNTTGAIEEIEFLENGQFIKGGEGYSPDDLPSVSVTSVAGKDAILSVGQILGDGESFSMDTTKIGAVSKLRIVSYGYDYVSAPSVSLRNMDIQLKDVTEGLNFVSNTFIYQGISNTNTTFSAWVDFYTPSTSTTGMIRLFNYKGTISNTKSLISDSDPISANVVSTIAYGDGRAKLTAKFENGLIRLPGLYLNTDGHLSSDKFLQDGEKFHNFSYVLNTTQDYRDIKNSIFDLFHPIGTKLFVNRIIEENEQENVNISDEFLITYRIREQCNVVAGENSLWVTDTNLDYDFSANVNVGDIIIVTSLSKPIQGTVNVTSGSNTVIATNANFINDIQDGDIIHFSTGNVETVSSVVDGNTLITQNVLNITATGATINIDFDVTKNVVFVNSQVILTDSEIDASGTFKDVFVMKIK